MTESEYKYMLTSTKYYEILSHLRSKHQTETIIQLNYYFDTSKFELDERDITL